MRSRSITGPVILVVIGFLFLINNVWRDVPFWSLMWDYWPVLLIVVGVIGLVEALYFASRGVVNPPRPLAGVGVVWIAMLIAMASWGSSHGNFHFGPFANGVNVLGTDYQYDVTAAGASQGVARVVLDNLHGNLSLKGQDAGGDVKVSGKKLVRAFSKTEADRGDKESPLHVDRQGDLLIIHADEPKNSSMLSVSNDLEIIIPKGIDVESRGRSGDLTVDDLGGAVDITNGRGDVRLSNIAKDVKLDSTRVGLIRAVDIKGKVDVLQSRGGDIQLENVQGPVTISGEYSGTMEFHALAKPLHFQSRNSDFRLEAVPGNVSLELGKLTMTNVTGPVRFQANTKDIEATDVSDGLEISVQRGDVEVTQSKGPLPKIEVHSHNGDVSLAIPEKAAFELEGTTRQGEISNDYGDPLKAEPDGRAASIKGKQGSGASIPSINIGTDRGSLTVKKS